jgi:transcription elongation factor GreA
LDNRNTDTVQIGSIVQCFCEYPDFTEEEVYEIVGYGESNLDENKLFYNSPVAKNLIGLAIGKKVSFDTPSGKKKNHLYASAKVASSTFSYQPCVSN